LDQTTPLHVRILVSEEQAIENYISQWTASIESWADSLFEGSSSGVKIHSVAVQQATETTTQPTTIKTTQKAPSTPSPWQQPTTTRAASRPWWWPTTSTRAPINPPPWQQPQQPTTTRSASRPWWWPTTSTRAPWQQPTTTRAASRPWWWPTTSTRAPYNPRHQWTPGTGSKGTGTGGKGKGSSQQGSASDSGSDSAEEELAAWDDVNIGASGPMFEIISGDNILLVLAAIGVLAVLYFGAMAVNKSFCAESEFEPIADDLEIEH